MAGALRVEEAFRIHERGMYFGVRVVETGQSSKSKRKEKGMFQGNENQQKIACWICGGPHMKCDCTMKRDDVE